MLLPVAALVRRADGGGGIGAALAAKAAGWGHRPIAQRLGRPAGTVRGWLRRFAERAEGLRAAFTGLLLVELAVDPPVLEGQVGAGDAVVAIVAAAGVVAARLLVVVSPWELACAVTSGRLLAPAGR